MNDLSSDYTEYRNHLRTNVHAHLPIVFDCRDVIIKCGQKVAHIENNGLGRWLNVNLNGQFVIAILLISIFIFIQSTF